MLRSWSMLSAYKSEDRRAPVRTLWSGPARRGIVLRPIDAVLLPLGVVLLFSAGTWFSGALVAIPLTLVGFWLFPGRLVLDAHRRSRTTYILRSDSILLYLGGRQEARASIALRDIAELELRGKPGRRDAIIVMHSKSGSTFAFMTPSWPLHGMLGPPVVEPEDASAVYTIMLEAMSARESAPSDAAVL